MEENDVIERVSKLEERVENEREYNRTFRNEIRNEVHEIQKQNEAIYEIAASVKVMASEMVEVKDKLSDVKDAQDDLSLKLDDEIEKVKHGQSELRTDIENVKNADANEIKKTWSSLKEKLLWLFVGGIAAFILAQIGPIWA